MPVYEYACEKCGQKTEFFVSRMGGKPDELKCQHCGSEQMTQALTAAAVHSQADARPCSSPGGCPTGSCPFAQ